MLLLRELGTDPGGAAGRSPSADELIQLFTALRICPTVTRGGQKSPCIVANRVIPHRRWGTRGPCGYSGSTVAVGNVLWLFWLLPRGVCVQLEPLGIVPGVPYEGGGQARSPGHQPWVPSPPAALPAEEVAFKQR